MAMYIVPTTERDLLLFSPAKGDLLEAEAMGIDPQFPPIADCVTLKLLGCGLPLAIGGNYGRQVWFVTDESVESLSRDGKREFRKAIIKYRDKMLAENGAPLWNRVFKGNELHIKFLKSIGAVFREDYEGDFQLFTIGG